MMPAIRVEGLWKRYRYGSVGYGTLRHDLQSWWARLRGREDPNAPVHGGSRSVRAGTAEQDYFWALSDVSFEVEAGDVIGIIGRNGAGKSTLLKVLSRVTSPTRGQALLRGRLSSLLEVGTGFHPDLTGRDNIFLNGAILGMSREEVRLSLDEIVAFAGIEPFVDTPVKRYSSGMYLRLAFAVAAHLRSEILLVDEVLAVGDAEFQRRCLGKMSDIAKEQRTVLFVSHNMNAVEELCGRILWLENGAVRGQGPNVREVIDSYLGATQLSSERNAHRSLRPNVWVDLLGFRLVDSQGRNVSGPVRADETLAVEIEIEIKKADPTLNFGFVLCDAAGQTLFWSLSTDAKHDDWPKLEKGVYVLRTELPTQLLNEGSYEIHLVARLLWKEWLAEPHGDAPSVTFEVRGGLSESPHWVEARPGLLAPRLAWQANRRQD